MRYSDDKRFDVTRKESFGLGETVKILVDRQTGINYMFVSSGYSGGLTVLLNRDGTPVITQPAHGGL